ncbi:tRNA (adenine(22)-N(1))-methyltransferase TrmK [Jeotgalibaca sp. MA1X17-3]|uniref:tRNA (adenine(22)-N(1))-methyltransferase n=1 Tax=Jeotgalibaca sp. MA1X17-3 TaxID=2908211 RepID=UPI001F1BC72F|nr:tRNA (adenine(22)-N(1))-methyltransferase TrmK [Jeotgalibaca sp. MA1X17-3]UJF14809.1 tRNA (adenine(22)-N(1))-methyltransferase TrmK [Jeotgalibaca sp. MA1X17-3]
MNEFQLSQRLETAASFVKKGARLADIGSDHAYLPCYLAQKGWITSAIAGEVVLGPFTAAKKQIEQSNVCEVVEARLGDGLSVVEPEDHIDTITICGMGGDLIARILDAGKEEQRLKGIQRLILQPNNSEPKLRMWLLTNGYKIIEEKIIEENEKIYEILVAECSVDLEPYTENDFLFGLFLRKEKSPIFKKKWQAEIKKYQYILNSLAQSTRDVSDKKVETEKRIQQIKEEIL